MADSGTLLRGVEAGDVEQVHAALDAGADPNTTDSRGFSALHIAAAGGYADIVNMLVAGGAEVNALDSYGATSLWWAASNGQVDTADVLLALGADINASDSRGVTPLMAALSEGHAEIASILLSMGADPRPPEHTNGLTALHLAAGGGDMDTVMRLLSSGADPAVTDVSGATPADTAAAAGFVGIEELLRSEVPQAPMTDLDMDGRGEDRPAGFADSLADGSGPHPAESGELEPGVTDTGQLHGTVEFSDDAARDADEETIAPGAWDGRRPEVPEATEQSFARLRLVSEADASQGSVPAPGSSVAPAWLSEAAVTAEPGEASTVDVEELPTAVVKEDRIPAPPKMWPKVAARAVLAIATLAAIGFGIFRAGPQIVDVVAETVDQLGPLIVAGMTRVTDRLAALRAKPDEPSSPPAPPAQKGSVNDFAGVLDAETSDAVAARLKLLKEKYGADVVVVTVNTVGSGSAGELANRIAKDWGLGSPKKDDAVVILVAVKDRDWAIRAGGGAANVLSADRLGEISNHQMKPRFDQGDFRGGLRVAAESIANLFVKPDRKAASNATRLPRAPKIAVAQPATAPASEKAPVVAVIVSSPAGAAVAIDRSSLTGTTPYFVLLTPGQHVVRISMEGYATLTETIHVGEPGMRYLFDLTSSQD